MVSLLRLMVLVFSLRLLLGAARFSEIALRVELIYGDSAPSSARVNHVLRLSCVLCVLCFGVPDPQARAPDQWVTRAKFLGEISPHPMGRGWP